MSGPRRLVLWDVDGTLLRGGPVAREALEVAVERALGRHPGAHGVRMSGKTDPQIVAEIVALAGVPAGRHEAVVDEALERLSEVFAGLAPRLATEGRAMPGVPTVLERLHARGDVLQTMLTGNIAPNAVAKVRAFGLERWLEPDAGAYGSDHAVRDRLVPVALERAARHAGRRWAPDDVWVVGDTPRDLACARAGGVRCLLVATGRYTLDDLDGLGADATLEDLSDVDRVEAVLAGVTEASSSTTQAAGRPSDRHV